MLRSRGSPSDASPPVGRPPPAILARASTVFPIQKPPPTIKAPPNKPLPPPKVTSPESKAKKERSGNDVEKRTKGSPTGSPRVGPRDTISIDNLVNAGLAGAQVDLDQKDEKNATSLHYACTKGLPDLVKPLLELGANPNILDSGGHTAFHRAVIYNRLPCVQALVESGKLLTLDPPDAHGNTPLQLAIAYGFLGIVNYLARTKADISRVDNEGNTPLHIAAQKNFFLVVETLIEAGANVNGLNARGHTPLHIASFTNALESATVLISRGASIASQDENGCTALHYACIRPESSAIVMALLEAGADPNMDDGASTPLHKAAYHGSAKAIEILINAGARVQEEPHHTTALHHAAFSGHLDCLNILLNNGADPNFEDQENASPLHKGSFQGHLEIVRRLLEVGADPNSKDDEGSTPLHKAAFSGHFDILSELLAHGAEVDAQDFEDGTALHNAAFNGHLTIIKALLGNQANINCADDKGSSPLHLAVVRGHEQCALFLVQGGAMCNVEDDRGMTPLHHAIAHPRCVSLLLNQGCEIDTMDKNGRTPLFFALKHSFTETSRILMSKGANPAMKDNSGVSAYEVADASMKMLVDIAMRERERLKDAELQKKYQVAAQKFNAKIKDGLEFLVTNNLVEDAAVDYARFLHTAEKLERERVGELLGEGDPKYIKILSEYVNYIDFTGMELDDALRFFLSKFSLPGEAQKIDRIMEKFAGRYCKNNPDVFVHEDVAYVLSFSLIMLNTDAHNPNIKTKMTKQQFIKNNAGISSGQALSEQYLGQLYDKIVKNEIKLTTAGNHTIFSNGYKKGFLFKQGGRIKTWKRRWFVLDEGCLYYFKIPTDLKPCGIVPLENLVVRIPKKAAARKYCFEVCNPDSSFIKSCKIQNGSVVQGHHEAYLLSAQGPEEMEDWMSAIRDSVLSNPLHQLIASRAKNKLVEKEKEREREREREKEKERQDKESTAKVDLNLLHEMANMCAMCYQSPATIKGTYGPNAMILAEHHVDYVKSALLGFFLVHPQSRSQTVVLCCSMWDNASPGLKAKLQKEAEDDKVDLWENTGDFDINKTFQVDKEIEFLDFNVSKFLKKDFSTFVLGHSVGGIIALVYAQRLLREGYPAQLITFGQPKILRREHADRFKQLPCVRVLDVKDPIPHHFAGFCHVGTEVVFMNATDVCVADVPGTWRRRRRDGGGDGGAGGEKGGGTGGAGGSGGGSGITIEKSVAFNEIEHYLQLIKQKNRMTGTFRRSRVITSKDSII